MIDEEPIATPTNPDMKQLSFEKTRFDYSTKMFDREVSRKQNLEAKAQFYLALVTGFLTVTSFSLPFLTALQGLIHNDKINLLWKLAITLALILLGLALIVTLFSVLMAMKLQAYQSESPVPTFELLFTPQATDYTENNETSLVHFTSRRVLEALDQNRQSNNAKAKWITVASWAIFVAVIMLAILLGLFISLQVYVVPPIPVTVKP